MIVIMVLLVIALTFLAENKNLILILSWTIYNALMALLRSNELRPSLVIASAILPYIDLRTPSSFSQIAMSPLISLMDPSRSLSVAIVAIILIPINDIHYCDT